MSVSPAVHDIMEATAQRLERGWREGGTDEFRLHRINYLGPMCLMDSLGYEAWKHVVTCGDDTFRTENQVVDEITREVIPALHKAIIEHPDIDPDVREKMLDPGNVDINAFDDPAFGAITWYNDYACKSGAQAADIVRRAAKEL